MKTERRRCAVYTRKSTEEGLEQEFNSLDAQRDACNAYILSQAHEGWEAVPELYDDGGFTGGNMDRPAMKQLLTDVEAGKVDIIVVYKVDRLTRSLADFARIVELLDEKGASFVSVTQSFNTTNSMGRLTLNVLLSFAQFEREVTSERIRDKIAASKKKGIWMGGPVPLGYDCEDRKLIVNEAQATTVRHIFERYLKLGSISQLAEELARDGYRTKLRIYKSGRQVGGIPFLKGPLASLLKNRIYLGEVVHNGTAHPGEHDAVIDPGVFEQVQALIARNRHDQKTGKRAINPSLLTGMLTDPDGRKMTPVHTTRATKRYRYYESRLAVGESKELGWRMPSGEIERLVIETVATQLRRPAANAPDDAAAIDKRRRTDERLANELPQLGTSGQREELMKLDCQVFIGEDEIAIAIQRIGCEQSESVVVPAKLADRGSDLRLIVSPDHEQPERIPDPVLLRLVGHAFAARNLLVNDADEPMVADYSKRHLQQLLRISYLAPDIISAIMAGAQPANLTGRRLMRATNIPLDWAGQRTLFGFA
ncbi:MAG: recombinase family protein [Pacificimonas sp.]